MTRLLMVALALAVCGPVAVQAQMNPLKAVTGMSKEDLAAMEAAAAKLYTDPTTTPGSTEDWEAPSGTGGTVRLVQWYQYQDMPCARLFHELQRAEAGDPQTFTIDRCQVSSGEWKIR